MEEKHMAKKFVLIFGPQAVGKMTVGQELEKVTELKLFHNHMSIELVLPFFQWGSEEFNRLNGLFRHEIMEAVAKSDQYGMIFTYCWAFNHQSDWDWVKNQCDIFERNGAEIIFVELEADMDERIKRNRTPNRLLHKPSKRNVEGNEKRLAELEKIYRLNSNEGEVMHDKYMRINTTNLLSEDTAIMIKEMFGL